MELGHPAQQWGSYSASSWNSDWFTPCASVHCRHHLTLGQEHCVSLSGSLCWIKREKVRSSLPGLGEVPAAQRESRRLPASSTLQLVPLAAAVQPGPDLMCLQPISPSPPSPAAQLLHLPVLEGQAVAGP